MSPRILGGPQRQARGTKSEVAASPLPSQGPKIGRNCYVTPAFSGVPNTKCVEKIRSGCLTRAFSDVHKRAELLRNPYILQGPQHQVRGTKSEVVTSPLPSWGPKRGRNCYITLTFSGSTMPSAGNKITSGCLTLAFLEDHKREELLRNPCILGGPQRQARATKLDVVASPLPSWGTKRGRNCNVTPAFSGVHNAKRGEKIRSGCLTMPSRVPTNGWNCYVTPAFSRVPKQGNEIRSGCLTPNLLGAH